ncbi:hypothetical protein FACS189438_0360 [Bacteroidia bacterium]|nr:hypothetical protein FACS189438_0360 [Bacteroidia bacterium]
MCKSNPYMLFKVPKGKDKTPTFLNEAEIKQIQDYNPVNEKTGHVKDLFIFQYFTGMAYIDLMNFSSSKVSEMEGMKVIRSSRSKTDELFVALLLPKAERIANRYNYELPKISNQKYNDYLKSLGAGAGIRKKLTTYVARHTFATMITFKTIFHKINRLAA